MAVGHRPSVVQRFDRNGRDHLFSPPSQTVIVVDLVEAFSDRFLHEYWRWWQRPLARLGGIVADKARAPLEWRLSFFNRTPARAARAKVLSWDCERVIMAHGEWRRSNGHAFLERSLAWPGTREDHNLCWLRDRFSPIAEIIGA